MGAAGLAGFGAVMLSALSAHGAPESRAMVQSLAQLLGWHAPAFLGMALLGRHALVPALWAMGLSLFGGSVLLRAFADLSLGLVAPIGGLTVMGGWLLLAAAALRR